jgi:hypothetical protein
MTWQITKFNVLTISIAFGMLSLLCKVHVQDVELAQAYWKTNTATVKEEQIFLLL